MEAEQMPFHWYQRAIDAMNVEAWAAEHPYNRPPQN